MLLLLTITFSLFTISCKKQNNLIYSCDQEVNDWVIENKANLANINHSEIITYNIDYQKAIYTSLEPGTRYNLWVRKFEEVLTLDWSNEEYNHLQYLLVNLQRDWFVDKDKREKAINDEMEFFTNSWLDYAEHDLSWSRSISYSVLVRLDNPIENNKLVETTKENLNDGDREFGLGFCKCNTGDDWCDGILGAPDYGDCKSGGCTVGGACGTLWTDKCNGICRLHVQLPVE